MNALLSLMEAIIWLSVPPSTDIGRITLAPWAAFLGLSLLVAVILTNLEDPAERT